MVETHIAEPMRPETNTEGGSGVPRSRLRTPEARAYERARANET